MVAAETMARRRPASMGLRAARPTGVGAGDGRGAARGVAGEAIGAAWTPSDVELR